ncbi:FkbM family methyltransferase [Pinisolibacter aquiterrae]|uniref:FkbM family methyltransferase n=1 Tax=Pinisolibacter aquiterrae TaxID=2815579 RepID=UPI001C3D630F|nr:FkbM family methyltransferase [Pinisolibacter aquiterrae]MBV5263331.1 FkbM family methyltransferase [Pinisolibacter aquiterrae]MCC8237591.1 FkbM family methyltransferase [Pinisolibacter aquiterrae]
MLLNDWVYAQCIREGVRFPDIPCRSYEFYGQCGEDLIVRALLEARAASRGVELKTRKYLEVGGNHPFATSATYLLGKTLGMTGVIVEANEDLLADLRKGRPKDTVVFGAVQDEDRKTVMLSKSNQSELSSLDRRFVKEWAGGSVGEKALVEVPALRIDGILAEHFPDAPPVYVSIDVEGLDLRILKDLDFSKYRPWFVQAEPSNHHIAGNGRQIFEFMATKGYDLIAATPVNLIFADRTG